MKKLGLGFMAIMLVGAALAQGKAKTTKEKLLAELSVNACKCIDAVSVYDKPKEEVTKEISKCIEDIVDAYQLGAQMADIDLSKNGIEKDGKKEITIIIDTNRNSNAYKATYFEVERYLMANCKALKSKAAADDKQNEHSFSENAEARSYYSKGIAESDKNNLKQAIKLFKKAVAIDSLFSFAYDNMGLCYRKLDDYDNAIICYKKSLDIDPNGSMPLQNIAIAYRFNKQYQEAIDAYERLAILDPNNPETFYGIGQIYSGFLNDMEKGLTNLCKAYNLYIELKSPYRTDAEKMISAIYQSMKKDGKEEAFKKILKDNNISF